MLKRVFFPVLLAGSLLLGLLPAKAVPAGSAKWIAPMTGLIPKQSLLPDTSTLPAVGANGIIYVMCTETINFKKVLAALNPANGATLWTSQFDNVNTGQPAIDDGGTIYVPAENRLYALLPSGGSKIWSFLPQNGMVLGPLALGADGTIYARGHDNDTGQDQLFAINPNGTQKWAITCPGSWSVFSSPAVGTDGTVYVRGNSTAGSNLYAFHPDDGSQQWNFCFPDGSLPGDPVIGADGTIYVSLNQVYSSSPAKVIAVTPGAYQAKWTFTGDSYSSLSTPSLAEDGTIYVAESNNLSNKNLYAINPDGTRKWVWTDTRQLWGTAVGANGTIYVNGLAKLYGFNPASSLIWDFDLSASAPTLSEDGTIYVFGLKPDGSTSYTLYAIYSNSPGPANSAWPMLRHDARRTGRAGGGISLPTFIPALNILLLGVN